MANTCKVYTFYMCPGSTVISLYIFAVWHKPNKGKKRDHNMFGIICYPPTSIPYCSLILNTIILNFFSAGIIMVWYHLGCGVSNNVAPKSKFFFSISSLVEPYIWEHIIIYLKFDKFSEWLFSACFSNLLWRLWMDIFCCLLSGDLKTTDIYHTLYLF